jgi:inosose dehydratase
MSIRIASAPVSWGIFEFEGIEPRYPWSQVLDEIRDSGYSGTELGPYGYLPTEPEKLRDELSARGLRLLSAFVPVDLVRRESHELGLQTALRVGTLLADLGAEHLVLADNNGSVSELVGLAGRRSGSFLSEEQWDVYAEGVNLIEQRLRADLGLEVVFHHHCAGAVETPEETQALLERTSVGLCLDTGHWHYAGGDAVECLKRLGKRVSYLHLKDCSRDIAAACREQELDYFAAVKAGVFCPLGQGEVDFPELFRQLQALEYDGWGVVEQDVLVDDVGAPLRFATDNRDYLRSLGV